MSILPSIVRAQELLALEKQIQATLIKHIQDMELGYAISPIHPYATT